jgi:putative alpha-1,2-mannosidase
MNFSRSKKLFMDSLYHDKPEGYSGKEGCGRMSVWEVWSIVGLYQS